MTEAGDAADDADDVAETSGADEPSQRGADEPGTSDADETDAVAFDLSCTDCSFETTVEGSVSDAFDVADAHQEDHGDTPTGHFVNFERRDGE